MPTSGCLTPSQLPAQDAETTTCSVEAAATGER